MSNLIFTTWFFKNQVQINRGTRVIRNMALDQFWCPPKYIPTFNWLLWEMSWFEFLIHWLLLALTTSKTAPTKYFWNCLKSTHFSQQLIWGINLRWASKLIQSHFPNEDVVDDTSAVMVDRFPTRSRGFWKSKQKSALQFGIDKLHMPIVFASHGFERCLHCSVGPVQGNLWQYWL